MAMGQSTTIPVKVGVIVDMESWVGKMGLSCISMALSDFYASHSCYKTRLILHTRDSKKEVVAAAAAALDLLKNDEVQAIIGPLTSMQAGFVIDLGDKAKVPIILFSATSPSLSSTRRPYFIRATQNDSSQVKAISAIVQAFGWRSIIPIYEDNEFGEGVIPFLTDTLQDIDVRVPYRSVIPPWATDDEILAELYKLRSMQTRVFIVHMWKTLGSRLFTKAKEVGMIDEGYVWIITDGLADILTSIDSSIINSMLGVIGVRPYIPQTNQLENFTIRWKMKYKQDHPTIPNAKLNAFGLWAYDATTALAIAVEKVGETNFGFQKKDISKNSTDLETFGISRSGPKLYQALLSTTFRGLTGDFHILEGQLRSSAYQIVNIISNGGREIGFWTPENGIVRELNSKSMMTYSNSKANLRSIIWPGDTTSPPKGWVIPNNGKKLRIGVPVKEGFREFVKVTKNPSTNTTKVEGYCIDVFEAVMASMPYAVSYEYIPFVNSDGKSAGSYNDLVYQVYLGNYDAVVGDTTIMANRSKFVDFTLPYTESGISMIVPIKVNRRNNAWVFLKPLTWDLWATIFSLFLFIGFVIWVLEHRVNEDFRGTSSHQVGLIFWFSFSTMVFAHKEKVVSNLARFVLIIWIFVVLILTQSYSASLTSMLTIEQLQPTITDVEELIKKGEYVGYHRGPFALALLKRMNFDESKLKSYGSPEECDELLSKGSKNGGVAAAIDEIPYMKLFLARYCSNYTMVEPIYKTDGFGFVFPIGSPLVADVSRAILNVTEGDRMVEIERALIGKQTCLDFNTPSNSLGLESFWGLFLIAGIASFLALTIFTAIFVHEHRHVLKNFDPKALLWEKLMVLARHFNEKDLGSHTFRKNRPSDRNNIDVMDRMGVMEASLGDNQPSIPSTFSRWASPNSNFLPSPSSFSNHRVGRFVFPGEQGTPSPEYGDLNSHGQIAEEIIPAVEIVSANQD